MQQQREKEMIDREIQYEKELGEIEKSTDFFFFVPDEEE